MLLADDCVASHTTVALGAVSLALQMGRPRFTFSEEGPRHRKPRNDPNLIYLRGEGHGTRYARFQCNLCTTTLANISKPHEMHETPETFFPLWQIPDAPLVVLGRQAHLHDFLSSSIDRGPPGRLAAQPALIASLLSLDALPLAQVAHMDSPLSKRPDWRPRGLSPVTNRAQQPTHADAGGSRMSSTDKSETHDESQVVARSGFAFGKEGDNDEAMMAEFGLVEWKEEELRLATVADVVSILLLMETLIEGLMEWPWPLPSPDSELGGFQQEGMLLACV